ncbi:hypothetical protein C273_01765 [Staphylococcus massiliensis S46]|uniref:Uncharacterized protein n=2 Tax=Staphylococcus massiliensis TaxID=555791 RepID=K9ASP4_9STAP|nr:hypothetical protein C273_01765 [Staphylococcus massiliensis S46]
MWLFISIFLAILSLTLLSINKYLSKRIEQYECLFDELLKALDVEALNVYKNRYKEDD